MEYFWENQISLDEDVCVAIFFFLMKKALNRVLQLFSKSCKYFLATFLVGTHLVGSLLRLFSFYPELLYREVQAR